MFLRLRLAGHATSIYDSSPPAFTTTPLTVNRGVGTPRMLLRTAVVAVAARLPAFRACAGRAHGHDRRWPGRTTNGSSPTFRFTARNGRRVLGDPRDSATPVLHHRKQPYGWPGWRTVIGRSASARPTISPQTPRRPATSASTRSALWPRGRAPRGPATARPASRRPRRSRGPASPASSSTASRQSGAAELHACTGSSTFGAHGCAYTAHDALWKSWTARDVPDSSRS